MNTYYCTFGQGQPLAGCYVVVKAKTISEAHNVMYAHYEGNWSMCYPEEKFKEAIVRWDLKEVPFGTPNTKEQ